MTADAVARFPDEETRRQIREELKATFLVEAGAGTGKTSALVERVVALVLGGRLIERIVAITFTEKAAAELRDRVRSGLEAREADAALSDGERKLLRQALNSIDRAPISTIHAFCQSLLRQFAPTLGIDPAFELQDEVLADRRFEEMWRLRLDSMGEDGDARAAVHRALNLGMLTRDIATLAQSLWQQPEFAPILLASPLTAPEVAWPNVGDIIRRLRGLGTVVLDSSDNLWVKIQALIVRLEEVARAGADREARLAELASLLALNYGTGRQGNWGGPGGVGAARETTQDVVSALNQTLDVLREQALAAVLRYVVAFVVDDTRARGREGKLVFDDLILQTRELLETNPDARRAVRERFDCMLIDEFQDTDPVQVQVARAFATESGSDTPDAGRLFLVGDPKQSIYRFRRADMASYSQTRSAIEAQDGRLPLLEQNRRSRDVIIGWVNAVFEGLIGPGANPAFQPPYHAIEPSRSVVLAGPGVAWFGDGAAMPARDVRAAEVRELAALVRGVVDEAWEVEDRATSAVRPATFRDLAILLPTRTILLQLERALQDAGVPYRVEGGSLVYGTQDVRDVINCLSAVDDPADEVAVVAALRSPAYACSDVDIVGFKLDGGRFDYLRADLDQRQGRVADGLRDLRTRHYGRHQGSLAAFVERFLTDRGLPEIGILDRGDRNSYRRTRFLVEQSRSFEAGGPESLRAFVSWLERRAGQAVLDNEGAGLDDDEDAVRVLTVHGSKGLEFPVVFLAGLGIGVGRDTRVFGMDRATREIGVAVGAKERRFTLGPVDSINMQEAQHLAAERDRLLYVAATRARDHLVVSLHHKVNANNSSDSAAARLISFGARDGAVALAAPAISPARRADPLRTLVVEDVGPPEEFDDRRAELVSGASNKHYVSATGLLAERDDDTEPWARGRGRHESTSGSTHVGRAVHATLQSIAWDAGDAEIAAMAKAQAVAEAIPQRQDEVARLVSRALATEAAGRARGARRALREVPFAMPARTTLVEGFADAVIETEDGAIEIIDWKTDDVTEAEVDERLAHYALQAGLYVLGLEAATLRTVSRITYVFVRPGVERSPGEPAPLALAARAHVEGGSVR